LKVLLATHVSGLWLSGVLEDEQLCCLDDIVDVLIQFPGTLHLYGCALLSLVDNKGLDVLTSLFGCVCVGHALILMSCVLAWGWNLFPGLDQLGCAMLIFTVELFITAKWLCHLVQCGSFVFVAVQVLEEIKIIKMFFIIKMMNSS
jgi:hypothetical protein